MFRRGRAWIQAFYHISSWPKCEFPLMCCISYFCERGIPIPTFSLKNRNLIESQKKIKHYITGISSFIFFHFMTASTDNTR